jgi:hypothetical protein
MKPPVGPSAGFSSQKFGSPEAERSLRKAEESKVLAQQPASVVRYSLINDNQPSSQSNAASTSNIGGQAVNIVGP